MNTKRYSILVVVMLWITWSCNQDQEPPVNPFDGQVVNQDTVSIDIINPEPASIAGIYQNILKPTCANSGCHDGTFEPDYRTLNSAYNTLVNQVPVKNDGLYTYRVDPFNPSKSALMARLKGWLTPSMPIQIEPDSDWPQKKDQFINDIQTWINNGAPDLMGNVRTLQYPAPQLLGAGADLGGQWIARSGETGFLIMPKDATGVRFYFAFQHQELPPQQFGYNKIAFSANPNSFVGAELRDLQILSTPRYERGFYGTNVPFTHFIDLDPSLIFDLGQTQWYFRVYVQDTHNPVTEIPTDNGIFYIKSYMSFRWAE